MWPEQIRTALCERRAGYLRVLVDKLGAVVDLVVDDDVEILLGVVLGNVLVGELLGGHLDGVVGERLSSRKMSWDFFLDTLLVSTIRASGSDWCCDRQRLAWQTYEKFGDLGTTAE